MRNSLFIFKPPKRTFSINAVSVTKTEVYTILRDVCIVPNLHLSEMEILAQPLCKTVFTPTTFRYIKRLPIRISKPSHKKFHFKNVHILIEKN
jgi:hypothetical protein